MSDITRVSSPKQNTESSKALEDYMAVCSSMDYKERDRYYDDEDMTSKYSEKERALKKINEEIERKSVEIFSKLEKIRSTETCHHDKNVYDEAGQGDAPTLDIGDSFCLLGGDLLIPKSALPLDSLRNVVGDNSFSPRASPSRSLHDARIDRQSYGLGVDDYTDVYFRMERPATSIAIPSTSSQNLLFSTSQLEPEARRKPVTARPIDELEQRHQARLQKATESVLKCVQSKLVNYEQRMTDLHLQYRQKIQENTMLEAKVKAVDEDRKRLLKTIQNLQTTTDKFSKSAENSKMNLNLKIQAFRSLKKEMDSLRKDLKQKTSLVQSLQTRLNGCTEENRRLKSHNQSTQLSLKQQHNEDRTTMEDLRQRIANLEQQKVSFQNTIEKQAKLIQSLRSQKVSLNSFVQNKQIKDYSEQKENDIEKSCQ